MVEAGPRGGGLRAAELAQAVSALRAALDGWCVRDVARITDGDDLLLVCAAPEGAVAPAKRFLHIAPGGNRARVCTTERRFGRERMASGPQLDALRKALADAVVTGFEHPAGERRMTIGLRTQDGRELALHVELFGPRGLWALCDTTGTVLEISRVVETAVRRLAPGSAYAPPPPADGSRAPEASRFQEPVLAAIDAHFSALDVAADTDAAAARILRGLDRAIARARQKADGMRAQLEGAREAPRIRHEADLLLAWARRIPRGADHVEVPDGDAEGGFLRIELDPALPAVPQAQARYERARRLEDAMAVTTARLTAAEAEHATLLDLQRELGKAPDAAELERLGPRLAQAGIATGPVVQHAPRARKQARGEDTRFRRYTSAEGYPVFVGKDNRSNDELTCRFARGNDVWLHVGGGRPGSHVVVRLPKGKTASLETLLDAATLAIHFSKARGQDRVDVIYTFAKHVRKPRGSPPGAVVPVDPRTLTVRVEPERLQRLLAGDVGNAADPG